MLSNKRKRLFAAFIDLKQAFDTILRDGLWYKLVNCNITGKCYRLIQNMYQDIKSCLTVNSVQTDFFSCNIGLRHGETLSPFLFSVYLNDLEDFFCQNYPAGGIDCMSSDLDDTVYIYVKLFLLMYADDTVILSETSEGLQTALNLYSDYCAAWKLKINVSKTKVVVFAKGRPGNFSFALNNENLEVVGEYKYLGVLFSRGGSFYSTKKHLAGQAEKAMYSLIKKSRSLLLPLDMQFELFDKLVKPILLYGSEVWGFGTLDILDRTVLKILKFILNMKSSTPNFMVYGESGVFPLYIDIQCRVISYWAKLVTGDVLKLSGMIYRILYSLFKYSNVRNSRFAWIKNVKEILNNCGMSGIWETHSFPNEKWLISAVKQKLRDIYIANWHAQLDTSSSATTYKLIKTRFGMENYLVTLPMKFRKSLIKIRTRNHRLPIETGRWQHVTREERICNLCNQSLGDEFHFILECKELKDIRRKYLRMYYYKKPNVLKFHQLFNTKNKKELLNLSRFIHEIMCYTQVS